MKRKMNLRYIDLSLSKIKLFVFGLVVSTAAIGQTVIEGQVVDAENGTGLPYSHVFLKHKQIGVVADENGYFQFSVNLSTIDTIVVSHVGFEKQMQAINNGTQKIIFRLKNDPEVLQEVVVQPITDAFGLFEKVVLSYQSTRRGNPHIARAFYSEKVRSGNDMVFTAESIGYSVFCGDSSKWTPLAKQNFFCDLTRLNYTDGWKNMGSSEQLPPMGNYVTGNFLMYVENYGLLSLSEYKDYKLDFDKDQKDKGYVLTFSGNGEKGIIEVTDDLNILIIRYDKTKKIWSSVANRRIAGEAEISYTYFDGIPFVSSAWISYLFGNNRHTINYRNLLQKLNHFEVSNDEIGALQRYARNPLIRYNEEEWDKYQLPYDSDLAGANLSQKTIRQYAGKNYLGDDKYDQLAIGLIETLSALF